MASAGDVPGARAAAATLAPFWDSTVRGRTPAEGGSTSGLFGKALRAADAVADTRIVGDAAAPVPHREPDGRARELVREDRRMGTGSSGRRNCCGHGSAAISRPGRTAGDRNGRSGWPTRCPACARGCTPRAAPARWPRSGSLTWHGNGSARTSAHGLASSSPSHRDEKLGGLGKPLASVLTAAAAIGAAGTRDMVTGYIRKQGDAVTALEMSALRAAAELPRDGARGDAGFGDLAADCAARLRARLARPQRAPGDWSIELPAGGCTCDLCGTFRAFLEDKGRRDLRVAARQAAQAAHPLPDRRGRTARHPRDQAARQPLHARPEQDRRALRPRAGGADQGRNGPGVARGAVESRCLTGVIPKQRAPWERENCAHVY